MALKRFTIDGYGQLEINNGAWRRDGRIEAQCKLKPEDFENGAVAENGMVLAVDNVRRIVKKPVAGEVFPVGINYSAEHFYDERAQGLKNFALGVNSFYPRIGFVSRGDKFTTNTFVYDDGDFADDDALKEAVAGVRDGDPLYGVECELGFIKVIKSAPTDQKMKLLVLKEFSMSDGQWAIQFQAI